MRIAFNDERFEEVLRDNEFETPEVRRPTYETESDAVVEIEFVEPLSMSEWPTDTCEPSVAGEPATGVRWLVDLHDESILAVTPLWGDQSCLDV